MKRIVRLTESDLVKLVKRVIAEQGSDCPPSSEEGGKKMLPFDQAVKKGIITSGGELTSTGSQAFQLVGSDSPSGGISTKMGQYIVLMKRSTATIAEKFPFVEDCGFFTTHPQNNKPLFLYIYKTGGMKMA
jgi:hypothetical protein